MGNKKLIPIFWLSVSLLVILQDYIFSSIRDIPFYWSEVLLWKINWLLCIPFSFLVFYLNRRFSFRAKVIFNTSLLHLLFSFVSSVLLIASFAALVSGISYIIPHYPYPFLLVFKNTFARDLYLYVLLYWLLSFMVFNNSTNAKTNFKALPTRLIVRKGKKQIPLLFANIDKIVVDGAYLSIQIAQQKYLHKQSLTQIQKQLDPSNFARINRSTIINLKNVLELKSRYTGDYDVYMKDGEVLRLSRNYREKLKGKLL